MSGNSLRGENHPQAKLNNNQVLQIRDLYSRGFSTKLIARNFRISTWNVLSICKRLTWTHL